MEQLGEIFGRQPREREDLVPSRVLQVRGLALKAYLSINPSEREEIRELVFQTPVSLGDFREEDARQVADAIHYSVRFPSPEVWSLPEAREAFENYGCVVIKKEDGSNEVHFFFSGEDFEKYLQEQREKKYPSLLQTRMDLSKN